MVKGTEDTIFKTLFKADDCSVHKSTSTKQAFYVDDDSEQVTFKDTIEVVYIVDNLEWRDYCVDRKLTRTLELVPPKNPGG